MRRMASLGMAVVLLAAGMTARAGEPARVTIQVDRPGVKVSPLLYGIFFEEINRAGEGGIWAELVQNRSFEDDLSKPAAWSLVRNASARGGIALDSSRPLNARNVHSLRIDVPPDNRGGISVVNEGFHGIPVRKGETYELSMYARGSYGFAGPVGVSLQGRDGKTLASAKLEGIGVDWKPLKATLIAEETDDRAQLSIGTAGKGSLWIDQVSLFPAKTYKGHGFRTDLAEILAAMKPAFIRFPGGCYVEGNCLANAFRWKDSIGDPATRPGHWNLWGYRSSDGLGYLEYLQLCEDLGSEPLYVINCGMAHEDHATSETVGEFVQDALDAIEYANGDAKTTKWGALRAQHGHPAPFHLKYLEVGNENGGPVYEAHYALFHDAIKKQYPDVVLVANAPVRSRPMEILDEHYYNTPEFFQANADKYDSYDRKGPKIYVGEYAVTQKCGNGNLRAALGEAAFMTGMERNSDVVVMASYAPLFENPGWKRWNPNAILFDAARSYGTPSYHVQALFAQNRSDVVLPLEIEGATVETASRSGRIGVGTWSTQAEFKDVTVTRDGKTLFASDFVQGTKGWDLRHGRWSVVEGALRQASDEMPAMAFAGDPSWTDYTLSLKARKLGGAEGFLISFLSDNPDSKNWWNIAGWGNQRHGIEHDAVPNSDRPGRVETGRWYDVRIEVTPESVRCFLDGQKVHDVKRGRIRGLYAMAGLDEKRGELVLKAVNPTETAIDATIDLKGATKLAPTASSVVLTGASSADENSFDEPKKVVPREATISVVAPRFSHSFPPLSVSVVRIKLEK